MSEAQAVVAAPKKAKAEVEMVKMSDGREVGFVGKRKMAKETLIDEGKIIIDGDTITMQAGAVGVRLDFRNGETRTFYPPLGLYARSVGHGDEQKLGDETAGEEKVEDMVIAVDDLIGRLAKGEWTAPAGEGGFGGASIVIRAIVEASGKSVEAVKAFLQAKLDAAKAKGEKLTRQELYASFRNPASKTGQIIERLEREERSKASKVDADEALNALAAS